MAVLTVLSVDLMIVLVLVIIGATSILAHVGAMAASGKCDHGPVQTGAYDSALD